MTGLFSGATFPGNSEGKEAGARSTGSCAAVRPACCCARGRQEQGRVGCGRRRAWGASAGTMNYRGRDADENSASHRQRLLRNMATMTFSSRLDGTSPRQSPTSPSCRGSPVRPISATFDGRCTIASPKRLMTPDRSRRTVFPTGTLPGKDNCGMVLPKRIALRQLYVSPPREPQYVNDARRGSIRFAVHDVPSPVNAPKRQEFARCAEARGMGGVFARSHAGCLPYCP